MARRTRAATARGASAQSSWTWTTSRRSSRGSRRSWPPRPSEALRPVVDGLHDREVLEADRLGEGGGIGPGVPAALARQLSIGSLQHLARLVPAQRAHGLDLP